MSSTAPLRARLALFASRRRDSAWALWGLLTPARLVIAALIGFTFVLGLIGWHQADVADHGIALGWSTLVHRSLAIFVLDANYVADPPLALQLARLLAPLAGAGIAVDILATRSSDRLHRWAARSAEGHHVLLGSPDQVRPYVVPTAHARTVHVTGSEDEQLSGVLRTRVDWTSGSGADVAAGDGLEWSKGTWLDLGGCRSADRVVLATGDDERNLRLLADLLRVMTKDTAGPRVIVEVEDPELVPWLSLSLAREAPAADVEFVCWQDTIARRSADEAMKIVQATATTESPSIVLLGDDRLSTLVGSHLSYRLARWHERAGAQRPRATIHLLAHEPGIGAVSSSRVGRVSHADLDGILAADPHPDVALALYSEATDYLRVGAQLRYRHKGCAVFVPARVKELAGGLRPLFTSEPSDLPELEGPFSRIAQNRYDRSLGAPAADADSSAWLALSHAARREQVRSVRCIVDALGDDPRVQITVGLPDHVVEPLPSVVARDLVTRTGVLPHAWSSSHGQEGALALAPYWFREGGLSVIALDSTTS